MATCAFNEVAAPHAHFHSSCYKFVGLAGSLRECISLCGPGAAPVCPSSDEENDFVWRSVAWSGRSVESIWLGWYKDESGSLSSCVSEGVAPEYAAQSPTDGLGPCTMRGSRLLLGRQWEATACDLRPHFQNGCVCGSSNNVSLADDVLSRLEAPTQAVLAEYFAMLHQQVFIAFAVAAVLWVIPMILVLCWLLARLRRSSPKVEPSAPKSRRMSESSESQPLTTQGETRHRLAAARRSLAATRLRVSGGMLLLGWTLYVITVSPVAVMLVTGHDLSPVLGPNTPGAGPVWAGGPVLLSFSFMLLAVMPIDAFAVRVLCWIGCASLYGFLSTAMPNTIRRHRVANLYVETVIYQITFFIGASSLLPAFFCSFCCPKYMLQPRAALRRVWFAARLVSAGCAIGGYVSVLATGFNSFPRSWKTHPLWNLVFATMCALNAIIFTPHNRGRLYRFIGSLGSKSTKESEAATIAALVGGGSASDALGEGAARFRALRLAELQESDLVSNADTGLYEKTVSAKLGHVDGFVSHSWQDPGSAKYEQLLSWGDEARRAGVAQPLVWLDKACIKQDQSPEEKQADINSLPVFLSGCRSLIVLAGPTYASRLWCVVELFVFLRMGGETERIRVMELGGVDVRVALNRFDAANAKCFLVDDQERLLAIVEAGFGSLAPFSALIRGIFRDARATHLEVKIDKLQASNDQLHATLSALEGKLDRVLGVVAV